jgi:hypothetical protein
MAIFGLIWTQFRSKQLKIWPESHFWSDRIELSGQILSCLDLNWVQIGPKMAILSCLDLNWVQIGPKIAIFVTGNGNYNSLFSKIFKIFNYFCSVVPYFEYFWVIFVNSSPHLFREIFASTEPLYIFKWKCSTHLTLSKFLRYQRLRHSKWRPKPSFTEIASLSKSPVIFANAICWFLKMVSEKKKCDHSKN